jgi:hypothetical protein
MEATSFSESSLPPTRLPEVRRPLTRFNSCSTTQNLRRKVPLLSQASEEIQPCRNVRVSTDSVTTTHNKSHAVISNVRHGIPQLLGYGVPHYLELTGKHSPKFACIIKYAQHSQNMMI